MLDSENRLVGMLGMKSIYHLTDILLKGELLQLSNLHFLRVLLNGGCMLCGGIDDL